MQAAHGGPRLLLRRLREVMAEPVSAQTRLDRIVVHIAANMVAEVCSVYVLRADSRLELYATEGLKSEAVHLTTMRADEGLVGLIAQTAESLALADAQNHPAFSYRPETGEEVYSSFLGVPVLRGGNTLGVLVVQNKARRLYNDEEVEVLQTTAMLLAEMIASGELQSLAATTDELAARRPLSLAGTPITEGIGLGRAVLHEPRIVVTQIVAEDVNAELARLDIAIGNLRASIDRLVDIGEETPGETRDILDAFRNIANDRGWLRRLREAVSTGLTAEAAVERVQSDVRAKMQRQTDPYLRERLHDLDDLANRLLHELVGRSFVADRADAARERDHHRPRDGARPRCSTTSARAFAAWCSRTAARRATWPSSRARSASPPSATSPTSSTSPSRATRSSSTARRATSTCARHPTSRMPMARRRGCARGARRNIASCATSQASRATASPSTCT